MLVDDNYIYAMHRTDPYDKFILAIYDKNDKSQICNKRFFNTSLFCHDGEKIYVYSNYGGILTKKILKIKLWCNPYKKNFKNHCQQKLPKILQFKTEYPEFIDPFKIYMAADEEYIYMMTNTFISIRANT